MSDRSNLLSSKYGLSGVYSEYDRQFFNEDQQKVRKTVCQAVKSYLKANKTTARLNIKVDFANAETVRHAMIIYRPPIVEFQLDQAENCVFSANSRSSRSLKALSERSSAGTDTRFHVVASQLGYKKKENGKPPLSEESKSKRVQEWLKNIQEGSRKNSNVVQPKSEEVLNKAVKEAPLEHKNECSDRTRRFVDSMTTVDSQHSTGADLEGPFGCISEDVVNGAPLKRVQVGGGLTSSVE